MTVPSYIYLIEAKNGMVKIGLGQNVKDRMQATRLHSPVLTRLIAFWLGDAVDDEALKEKFRAFRHHGEWFYLTGEFAEFVDASRGLGVGEYPDWDDLVFYERETFKTSRHRKAVEGKERSGVKRGRQAAPDRVGLTRKQLAVLRFIQRCVEQDGSAPSYAEIGAHFGLCSKSGVHRIVHCLVERGHISIAPGRARAITLEADAGVAVSAAQMRSAA